MAAPVVQSLAEVMAELNPAYASQEAVVQKRQAGLGAKYDSQRAALTAAKGQGFNAINNQAVSRGASFSGVPIDEQATYLSTKYLPGMQQADFQQNEEDLTLQGQLAEIGSQKTLQALGRIDKQKSDLNAWNMQQAQLQAQAREAELNRQHQARMQAQQVAASRAAAASSGPSNAQIVSSLNAWTKGKTGKDGKLSPNDFKAGYQMAASYGMSVADYTAVMAKYINNRHAHNYTFSK